MVPPKTRAEDSSVRLYAWRRWIHARYSALPPEDLQRELKQRVTLELRNVEFDEALDTLRQQTAASIVVDPQLYDEGSRALTLSVRDRPLKTALRGIARELDGDFTIERGVIFLGERVERKQRSMKVAAYDVSDLLAAAGDGGVATSADGLMNEIKSDLGRKAWGEATWLDVRFGKLLIKNTPRAIEKTRNWLRTRRTAAGSR